MMRKGYVDGCIRVIYYVRCFFIVTYVYNLYFSLNYVFVRHIWIWRLNANYNNLK
jgi:hypothetical protein